VRRRLAVVFSFALLAMLAAPGATAGATLDAVSFIEFACPASIQTPSDLVDAGGPRGVCAVAGRTGDFGTLDPGYSWALDPIEFDLQASLHTSDSNVLTNPDPNAGGVCDSTTMTCDAYQSYAWFGVPSGATTLVEDALPPGFAFGWATISKDGGDATAATELIQTDGPTLLNGWDTLTFAALAAGVGAVVWGAASFLPVEAVRLHRLLLEDLDLAAARDLWASVYPICALLESTSYVSAVKAACRVVGLTTGPVRAPLLELPENERLELERLLAAAGIGAEAAALV